MQVALRIDAQVGDDAVERVRQMRSITGRISIRFGTVWFPSEGWNDFVVAILCSLARTLALLKDEVVEVHTHFMEGPYEVYCRRRNASRSLAFSCVRDDKPVCPTPFHVDRRRYGAEIARAGAEVLLQLKHLDLSGSREATELRRLLSQMRREEERRRNEGWLGW